MLQVVDAKEAVRVDVFNDGGAAARHARTIVFSGWEIQMISVEDRLARMARLSLDIGHGKAVPAKHARDFLRILKLADADNIEMVWAVHRRPKYPVAFQEASDFLQALILKRQDLLIQPDYSNDIQEVCQRCIPIPHFPLADRLGLHSLLGY